MALKDLEETKVHYGPSISITSGGVREKLEEFKVQMDLMNALFKKIKGTTVGAKGFWEGNQSDLILGSFENFQKIFDEVTKQNEVYVKFLNGVISAYSTNDREKTKAVEEHIGSYSMD